MTLRFDWWDYIACKGMDVNAFFPSLLGKDIQKYIDENLPCNKCIVKAQCMKYADENEEEWGVWGGEYRSPHVTAKKNKIG
jgi:hypothetical protein